VYLKKLGTYLSVSFYNPSSRKAIASIFSHNLKSSDRLEYSEVAAAIRTRHSDDWTNKTKTLKDRQNLKISQKMKLNFSESSRTVVKLLTVQTSIPARSLNRCS